jgi:hypothetical protein
VETISILGIVGEEEEEENIITEKYMHSFFTSCFTGMCLTSICLDECYLSERVLLALANGCPRLKRLGLYDCRSISISGWEAVCMQCKELIEVSLFFPESMDLAVLTTIKRYSTMWRSLIVGWPNEVENSSILDLFQLNTCYSLRSLSVFHLNLPVQFLEAIGRCCHLLTMLELNFGNGKKSTLRTIALFVRALQEDVYSYRMLL